ncbi:MAG: T9SS type A sorting domain-containing protein [Bacteroidota bacterium]
MTRVLITILLIGSIFTLPAQQLERIFQGGSTTLVDAQNCTSSTTCDDLDPNTIDICLAGRCAHTTMSGILPSTHVYRMQLNNSGDLWYTSRGGLTHYDGINGSYITPINAAWPTQWTMSKTISPLVSSNGDIWVVGSDQAFGQPFVVGRWDGSQFTSYSNQSGALAAGSIVDMAVSSGGEVSILHFGGMISQYDGSNWTAIDLSQFTPVANFNARAIEYDSAGELWLGGIASNQQAELAHYDGTTWSYIPGGSVVNGSIINLTISSNDTKWLYSIYNNGLMRYDGAWNTYTYPSGGLTSGNIHQIAEGQNGLLWMAMGIGGLARFNPNTGTANSYTYLNSSNPLHSVNSVAASPNTNFIYFGNHTSRKAAVARFNGLSTFTTLPLASGPNYESTRAQLSAENDNNLWYQGFNNGEISYYDGSSWSSLPYLGVEIYDLIVDLNGTVWLTVPTNVGNQIIRYDGNQYLYLSLPTSANALGEMALDANGHLWVSFVDGIIEYDGFNWTPYSNANGNFPTSSPINHVANDANGAIWIWCDNGEIYTYDGTNWNLIHTSSSTWYAGILSSNQGTVWFASRNSLNKIDNGSITTYDHANSPWSSVRIGRIALDTAGQFWAITTNNRLIHFDGQNYPSYDLDSMGFYADTASYLAFTPSGDELWVSNRSGIAQFSYTTTIPIDSVWPGDANDDLVANNMDYLALGQAFGSSGPARPNASINWQAEAVNSWSNSLPNGANYAHTDTDGSGTVGLDDTLAVTLNYGLTHNKNEGIEMNGATPLLIVPDLSSYMPGDTVNAPIILGLDTLLADSVYGLAFTINYDPTLVDSGSFKVDFGTSWLGNKNQDMITMARDDYPNAQVDLALCRTNQVERSGWGQIAKVRVVMIDDISGKDYIRDTLRLTISNVRLIRLDDTDIPYDTEPALVEITQEVTSIADISPNDWQIYPNPAQDRLIIRDKRSAQRPKQIKLYDLQGRIVYQKSLGANEEELVLPALPNALYLLQIQTEARTYQQKLQILR